MSADAGPGSGEPRQSGDWGRLPTGAALDPMLSRGDLRVLILLASYAGKGLGYCWPGQRTLAERLKTSRAQVQRCLDHLKDRGYIRVDVGRGKTSGYQILGLDRTHSDGSTTGPTQTGPPAREGWTQNHAEVDPSGAESGPAQAVPEQGNRRTEGDGERTPQTPSEGREVAARAMKEALGRFRRGRSPRPADDVDPDLNDGERILDEAERELTAAGLLAREAG